jgi:hypothetical protein
MDTDAKKIERFRDGLYEIFGYKGPEFGYVGYPEIWIWAI